VIFHLRSGYGPIVASCSVLFFSHPRSEGWPHHKKVKVPSLTTLYTNEECQRRGIWVRTTCPESLRSRVLTGNRTRDLLIASPTPYRCATTPRHATPWTYFLHLYLFSGILIDSSTGSPVHVLMLSTQAVRGLPRLREPGIVPCIISFSRQLPRFLMVDHSTLERLALTVLNSSLFTPALLRTHSFVFFPLSTKHAESFSDLSSQRRQDEFLHFFLGVYAAFTGVRRGVVERERMGTAFP